ncbi:hypothetical protein PABY_05610 [Pyrodictium abyssi]|uniref:Uncharacterized protein n=1 Tax=Pyrodictium abyssi TaxID=54256 RepID=A0ABN6ZL88_9CREN|nr:hypothetical protein PABY_05610 [Pyrodictium abyssi]
MPMGSPPLPRLLKALLQPRPPRLHGRPLWLGPEAARSLEDKERYYLK